MLFVVHSYYWAPLLLLFGGGGIGGKGVSLALGAPILTYSAAESISSSSATAAFLDSDGKGGDGAAVAADIVPDNTIRRGHRGEAEEPTVEEFSTMEEQRWLQQQQQRQEENTNTNTTTSNNTTIITNSTTTMFDAIVVVVIESSFINATPEEIIQFQNDFRDSYNLVNNETNNNSSSDNNNTTTSNDNTTTTTSNDPLEREIRNVTLEYNFTFTPGLHNVPMNPVRHERERDLEGLLRDLQVVDDTTTTTPGAVDAGVAPTTSNTTTIKLPTQRYIQIVLFVSAACTRCPSNTLLFDDVSTSDSTFVRRQLQTILNQEEDEKEEKEEKDNETFLDGNTTTTNSTKQRGPLLEDVLSVLQSRTTFDVPELVEVVEDITCPRPSNMYFSEIVLELRINYSLATSQEGQDALIYLFQFIFNTLSQRNYCDPLYRTVMNVQIDDVILLDDTGEDKEEETVVGILFLVEVHCLGVDCEQYGHGLFDDDDDPDPQQRRRRRMSFSSSSSPNSQLPAPYPSQLRANTSRTKNQNNKKEEKPSWMSSITTASKVPHPSPTTSKTKTQLLFQQQAPPSMKSKFHRTLRDDPFPSWEEKCYCDVNPIDNRAPTRPEFVKIYQLAIDDAIVSPLVVATDGDPADAPTSDVTRVPTSSPPTLASDSAPTPGPIASLTPGPTPFPTPGPTFSPTLAPSSIPTAGPSPSPTAGPSPSPTAGPTSSPTAGPSPSPTAGPSPSPTAGPSPSPTAGPTSSPTAGPSPSPTAGPSPSPTPGPTSSPTPGPTPSPTAGPTPSPTPGPTPSPTPGPTPSPTPRPTPSPTPRPTPSPTPGPTPSPTTPSPTPGPTPSPTPGPTPLPNGISLTFIEMAGPLPDGERAYIDFLFNPNTAEGAWIGLWPPGSDPSELYSPSAYWISICNGNHDETCSSHPTSGSLSLGRDDDTCGAAYYQQWKAFLIESSACCGPYVSIAQSETFTY